MSQPAEPASDEPAIEIGAFDLDDAPPAEPPRPPSPIRRVLLIALLVVALAGVVVLGRLGWQIASEKDASLATPTTIGSLRLDDSEDGRSTADYLQTALSAEVDLDKAVGAVYLDAGNKNVLFFGGTTLFWTPESDLDTAFDLISDNEGAVTGLHSVDAGPLGGTMKCGSTKTDDGPLTVCGWADHGSLALALFNNRSEPDSAALLREIRAKTQTRS
ncbi:hypothetical protein HH310_39510 [Actinoplanes sp. TBRC 11911]|uniref:hypothetical protein n=1 Tax=Actinoplanes sp. TBRC 11911 TaxID=2729386 RepID=UPI00145ECEAC|nr:hypothetical protein [Actinoplanes sp. TBRC 11911]NMO57249.1 hypothetical protein [Actinoplanes sp. TBRC 11911]